MVMLGVAFTVVWIELELSRGDEPSLLMDWVELWREAWNLLHLVVMKDAVISTAEMS
jgi:hypothetical protein